MRGWNTLVLANDRIEVTVLPEKGGDIYSIVDRCRNIDVLFKSPWDLKPPEDIANSRGLAFLDNYEGGWQELLPNTGDACIIDGKEFPFHGEVATRPWSASVSQEEDEAAISMSVVCSLVPVRLERTLRCRAGEARVVIDETISNCSDTPTEFCWGHHCVLGPPLVAPGAILRVPCGTIETPAEGWEETARLQPGQQSAWPYARLRSGSEIDLSVLPGVETGSHDDVYLTNLNGGWAELWNNDLKLGFRLDFDARVFGCIVSWQVFGGAHQLNLTNSYALGLEPWTCMGNLKYATDNGYAVSLDAHGSMNRRLVASLIDSPGAA